MRHDLDSGGLDDLARSVQVRDVMRRAGEGVRDNAQDLAPGGSMRRSAREGIVSTEEMGPDGWEAHVGHVVGEYGFHLARVELGTRFSAPQPHLRPAATMPLDL